MVFENLTLFEIQLEGAQIGPETIGSDDTHDDEMEAGESGGRGRFLPVLLFVVMALGVAVLYRRASSTEVEFDAEREDAEADLADAQ